ncbi:IS110 family transposase [Mesorhizobium sp. M1005]|uniref:IS110 family transposase n=1 Tax=unclassified Mesorhizobium TaxID=325217 RepID=UPI00333982A1
MEKVDVNENRLTNAGTEKTDAADAEAICEAVTRPNMRFVPVKTREQQAILALHRVRSLLVRQRTASINAVRGLLSEFGLVAGKGSSRVVELRRRMEGMESDLLPQEARAAIDSLFDHIDALQEQIETVEDEILAWHKTSEDSQRLASAPGVGPMTATAIVAAAGDGHQFRSARHFAGWLGQRRGSPPVAARNGSDGSAKAATDICAPC